MRHSSLVFVIVALIAIARAAAAQAPALPLQPQNLGDAMSDLVYTPLQKPCRIIDTRNTIAGALVPGVRRDFFVAGGVGFQAQGGYLYGCGIPENVAAAVNINFVAVSATGAGNLRGSAYPNPVPATGSVITYAASGGLNVANGVVFPICDASIYSCASDISLVANGSSTHLVADVLGWFSKTDKNRVRSFTTTPGVYRAIVPIPLAPGCANYEWMQVNAPVPGKVTVRAIFIVSVTHAAALQRSMSSIYTETAVCTDTYTTGLTRVGAEEPPGDYMLTGMVTKQFSVPAGFSRFYLNGNAAGVSQSWWGGTMQATFEPD